MYLKLKYLSLSVLAAMLSACGGGSGGTSSTESNLGSGSSGDSHPSFSEKYPEPTKDVVDDTVLGFYDYDKLGLARTLRNDLNGSFSAMIQFAQSHVVNPKNNEKDYMPRLTSEKEALLLVTPLIEMGKYSIFKSRNLSGQSITENGRFR